MTEDVWRLKTAEEATRSIVCSYLSASRSLPEVKHATDKGLSAEEIWERHGEYIGLMYQKIFDKVLSKLEKKKTESATG